MIEIAYKNRDNPIQLVLKEDGVAIDFSAVTRMVAKFSGQTLVADTADNAALIDWSGGSGKVTLNLNDLGIDAGVEAYVTLIAYDPDHADGQVLINGVGIGTEVLEHERKHLKILFLDDAA